MKKLLLVIFSVVSFIAAGAFPKAFYVKKGDTFAKYNFGVAGDLKFSNNGRTLSVTGYEESINLDQIDYITFNAPLDNTGLTPAASKERLIEIGEEFNSKINTNDQADMICMLDIFIRKYCDYYLSPEYYDVHPTLPANVKGLASGLVAVAKGDYSGMRRAKLDGVEIYQTTDYFGVFKANDVTRTWEKISDADYLELIFNNADKTEEFRMKLTQSAQYTDWTEVDFVGRVPKTINVVGTLGNKNIFDVAINSEIDNTAKSAVIGMVVNMQNGYKVENDMAIYNSKITDDVKVRNNNGVLVTTHSVLHGNELTNYDNWKTDFENTHGEDEYYDENLGEYVYLDDTRAEMMAGHIAYATSDVDVLGKLQVKGRVSSISKLYDVLSEDSELEDYIEEWDEDTNTLTYISEDENVIDNSVLHLNNYSDISFYYDGTSTLQGFVAWERSVDDSDRWYDEDWQWDEDKQELVSVNPHWVQYLYYDTMPLLMFPDLTTFAIEDYFTEDGFSPLINDYNAIIDLYYTISGNSPEE